MFIIVTMTNKMQLILYNAGITYHTHSDFNSFTIVGPIYQFLLLAVLHLPVTLLINIFLIWEN